MSDAAELSYRDLQKKCKELGLDATGSKGVLQKRLEAHIKEHGDNPLNGADAEDAQNGDEVDAEDEQDQEEEEEEAGDDEEVIEAHEDDEDDDEDDEVMRLQLGDGNYVELIGALVRKSPRKLDGRTDAPSGEEKAEDEDDDDEDDKLFVVGTKVLRQAYQDELSEAIQTLQEKEEEILADEEAEAAEETDADSDAESDFDLEPQLYRKGHVSARLVSQFLSIAELLFVFIALLHLPSSTASDPDLGERASGFQVVLSSFVAQTLNPSFWISLVLYFVCFFAVPTLLGLLVGKYNTAECVFGFAVARWVCFYLLSDYQVFDWGANAFVNKLFNVTTAVSLVSAFWEKQSEHYL